MSKSPNQKLKLYRLAEVLMENTDEEHGLSMAEIREKLLEYDISADRKSLYDDIALLPELGIEVEKNKVGRNTYYHVIQRPFELAELKLLVDLVQSSRFITKRKSGELIRKLTQMVSRYEAAQLKRQIFVSDRIKTMNESIYYNVDEIHNAIAKNRKISFEYLVWNTDRELVKKHEKPVRVSPWALLWQDENYYLIAFDSEPGIIKHYRVDKMRRIGTCQEMRDGRDCFERLDMGEYVNRRFGMFGGREEMVRLRFQHEIVGVLIDRFGKEISIHRVDETHSDAIVSVAVSDQFFGWVFGLGGRIRIMSPGYVAEQYREALARSADSL